MSRPVAGVRTKTIIITLPGSPKGAKENLQSILKLLPHACQQAAGGDSRKLHSGGIEKLEKEGGVNSGSNHHSYSHSYNSHAHSRTRGHDHGHAVRARYTDGPRSNDLSLGPTGRNRSSQYRMSSVEDALKLIAQYTPAPSPANVRVDGNIIGSVLAEEVTASEAVPAYRASTVDGYAIIARDNGSASRGIFPVASISHAAPGDTLPLKAGQIARITTGAPLPPGVNAVVIVEDTVLKS